ncbi:MAG: Rid family hydrolase [Acidimicrobiia bacterium]|nr:Rid family hydrolase [Acidimicrobiia bacterium]
MTQWSIDARFLGATICQDGPSTNREFDMADRRPAIPEGQQTTYDRFHFAPAFRVGDTVYVSGVIGAGDDGAVPAEPAVEFANVFAGLAAALQAAGASMDDIVDMTSFHTDAMGTLGDFMAAKDAAIAEPYPAWTAIGCTGLAIPGARVEVKVTAVVDGTA